MMARGGKWQDEVFVSIPREVLSSDGVTIKVSLVAKYEVIEPETVVNKVQDNKVQDYQTALYMEIQLGVRRCPIGAVKGANRWRSGAQTSLAWPRSRPDSAVWSSIVYGRTK